MPGGYPDPSDEPQASATQREWQEVCHIRHLEARIRELKRQRKQFLEDRKTLTSLWLSAMKPLPSATQRLGTGTLQMYGLFFSEPQWCGTCWSSDDGPLAITEDDALVIAGPRGPPTGNELLEVQISYALINRRTPHDACT
jgi:hypothetical protein